MEMNFTSYTKKIEGTTFYFVKRFIVFPELDNMPPLQDGFGMHTDFDTACSIAGVGDAITRGRLWDELENDNLQQAKVIEIGGINKKAANNW